MKKEADKCAKGTLLVKSDEIRSLLKINKAIEAVETAFREKANSRVQMPTKLYITFEE